MDYLINLTTLATSVTKLDEIKTKSNTIKENYNGSYLNKLSSTEISSSANKLKQAIERLNKGYTNSSTWFNKYKTDINTLEDSLSNLKTESLKEPTEFKGEFIDLFGKRTMPAIQTNGDKEFNSKQIVNTNGHLLEYTYDGKTYLIANTKISLDEYVAYIQKNKLCQNGGVLGGQCMLLSQYYAVDLLRGTFTSRDKMNNTEGAPATRINEKCNSGNSQDILNYIYQELSEGNPVVLQVTQKKKGCRHLVTVVGMDASVKSAADLTEDKLLVLDCYDGKVQTLNVRNRHIYNQGRGYLAYGPTEKFKNKEVYTTA